MISKIEDENFIGLTTITKLNISQNLIKNLVGPVFRPLTSLKILDLSKNQIEKLDHGDLFNLDYKDESKLEILNLSRNRLRSLNSSIFESLTELKILDLSYNYFYTLNVETFQYNTQLSHLYLNENWLKYLPNELFSSLRLEKLDLSSNRFNLVNNEQFGSIETVELRLNNMPSLRKIDRFSFTNMHRIQTLIIENNRRLKFIDPSAFIKKLADYEPYINQYITPKYISLRGNGLTYLNKDFLRWSEIEQVDLSNNNWDCTKDLSWMKKLNVVKETKNEFYCVSPQVVLIETYNFTQVIQRSQHSG